MSHRFYTKPLVLGLIGCTALCYPYFNNAIHPLWNNHLMYPEKTAIITGGTGNLAQPLAFQFALRKVRVIMACRDMDKCKSFRREIVLRTGHKGIACRHLDLEDVDSIEKFVKEISASEPHIDILVNNAAVKDVKERELTKYGIEKNYFVNFLAPFLLTFSLYDKLNETAAVTRDVRIINIIGKPNDSWEIDLDDINFDKRKYTPEAAYKQSKLALAFFTLLLEDFNKEKRKLIYVYGTNPGSKKILKSWERPIGFETVTIAPKYFISNSPDRMIMNVVRCSLEPKLADRKKSGLLYSYILSPVWGWGGADQRENDAKLVWNAAMQTLLNLSTKSETKETKSETKIEEPEKSH